MKRCLIFLVLFVTVEAYCDDLGGFRRHLSAMEFEGTDWNFSPNTYYGTWHAKSYGLNGIGLSSVSILTKVRQNWERYPLQDGCKTCLRNSVNGK